MEFVQLQINYVDWEDEIIQSRKCYEVCVKHIKIIDLLKTIPALTDDDFRRTDF